MTLRSIAYGLAAGVATFLVVGVAVTELARSTIAFSLLVGLPAGLVAGVLAAALVYVGVADDAPARRRRVALAAGSGSGAFLLALLVAAGVFDVPVTLSLVVASVGGVLTAVGAYVYHRRRPAVTPA